MFTDVFVCFSGELDEMNVSAATISGHHPLPASIGKAQNEMPSRSTPGPVVALILSSVDNIFLYHFDARDFRFEPFHLCCFRNQ